MAVGQMAGARRAPAVSFADCGGKRRKIRTAVISEYNERMREPFRRAGFSCLILFGLFLLMTLSPGQAAKKSSAPATGGEAERATNLAESGHCVEALPLLKRAIRQTADRDLKKKIGLDGLHCAMTHSSPYDSLDFLVVLSREFPRDPEVLYTATHAYSDLSMRTSQDLAREAPFSFQVHELNAEALEIQGRWDEAAAEYRRILDINPMLPGIHARLGRALLSKPQPSPTELDQARKSFEEELEIDPRNATAEFVLGQLAADAKDSATAIRHFTRATKLDVGFMEAYLGLGTALNSAKQFTEAIPPLETYEKMAPDSPTGHYQLAVAYAGAGRREDSNREAALQRQTSEALEAVKRKAAIAQEKQTSTDAQPAEPK
jgi:tetratricopeptide (TPR) repeat protein